MVGVLAVPALPCPAQHLFPFCLPNLSALSPTSMPSLPAIAIAKTRHELLNKSASYAKGTVNRGTSRI